MVYSAKLTSSISLENVSLRAINKKESKPEMLGLSALNLNKSALNQIKPNCFYIGFTSGNGILAKITKKLTSTNNNDDSLTATHATLIYADKNKKLFVIDCGLQQGGLKKQEFETWLSAKHTIHTKKIFLYEAQEIIDLYKFKKLLEKKIGYSVKKLCLHGLIHSIPLKKLKTHLLQKMPNSDNFMICSEVVAHCLKDQILEQLKLPPKAINPAHLEYFIENLSPKVVKLREEENTENNNLLQKFKNSLFGFGKSPYSSTYAKSAYSANI